MTRIHVCALSMVDSQVESSGARSLVSVIGPGMEVLRPAIIPAHQHLQILVSDIVAPLIGYVLPDEGHMRRMLDFFFTWDRQAPLLVHCFAGVSRSTASAFIAACALSPLKPEIDIAREIREKSPTATPNARLVALADEMLDREGRMIAAVNEIGRGRDCYEGVPFALEVPAWRR